MTAKVKDPKGSKKKDEIWRCQFCGEDSCSSEWVRNKCPKCKLEYDPILAQEGDDG